MAALGHFFGDLVVSGVSCKVDFGRIFEKCVFVLEKVEPSVLSDTTTILLYFRALRPPGKLHK